MPEPRDEANRLLAGVLTPEGIERWWHRPHPELDGLTPDMAWECWCHEEVMDLIREYLNPNFT
jgi:hypothetical protein